MRQMTITITNAIEFVDAPMIHKDSFGDESELLLIRIEKCLEIVCIQTFYVL